MFRKGLTELAQAFEGRRSARLISLISAALRARRRSTLALVPGLASIVGLAPVGYRISVILAVFVWVVVVLVKLLLEKRRDDVFAEKVRTAENTIDLIRAITINEAVRSRQLTSDDIVKLLKSSDQWDHDNRSLRRTGAR
jgi:hypothetical protein